MSVKKYALESIEFLYEEGDIDLIFLSQILGFVSYDSDDAALEKTSEERIFDAIKLMDYLVLTDDFYLGRTRRLPDGSCIHESFENKKDVFFSDVIGEFKRKGIDDLNFQVGFWIKKKKHGTRMRELPEEVISLFGD